MQRGSNSEPFRLVAAILFLPAQLHVVTGLISCEQIGLQSINQEVKGYCQNATSQEHFRIIDSNSDQVVILPSGARGETKICTDTPSDGGESWFCITPKFLLSDADMEIFRDIHRHHIKIEQQGDTSRAIRSAEENGVPLARKGVQFSLIEIGGVSWVCEQLSELQCKPLWPKEVEAPKETVKSGKQLDTGAVAVNSWDLQEQVSAIINDRDWAQERSGGFPPNSGNSGGDFVILEDELNWQSSENGTQQAVYNINGITWLCRQQNQLQCFPVFSPWDESAPVGGNPGSITIADRKELQDEDQGYPDFPGQTENSVGFTNPKDFIYTNQRAQDGPASSRTRPPVAPFIGQPPPPQVRPNSNATRKKTTFCSRIIRFLAKDEVLLKFDTFFGSRSLFLQARRVRGQETKLTARLLSQQEQEGQPPARNSPPVNLDTQVDCDTIIIRVDGLIYKLDYSFGREGVRDLEVVGNLESTGMVPRDLASQEAANRGEERSVNYLHEDYRQQIELVPQPPPGLLLTDDLQVDGDDDSLLSIVENVYIGDTQGRTGGGDRPPPSTSTSPTTTTRSTTSPFPRPNSDTTTAGSDEATAGATTPAWVATADRPVPVVQDNFQVVGTGDVVISLAETENITHLYKISKADSGDVNVEIVGSGKQAQPNRSLIIDNKDYNYTLIITGTTFQIVHHDTNKNATYTHGIEDSHIAGVGVTGDVTSNQISFKDPEDTSSQGRAFPFTQELSQPVDIYGNLCVQPCALTSDGNYWCQVAAGGSRKCGPAPGFTPNGDRCQGDCRKRNDDYYWCHVDGKPWDYCSPPLFLRATPPPCSPSDTQRTYTPDEGDCSRYLLCELGNLRLEECPEGLHYYHANRTCQWPALVNCRQQAGSRAVNPNASIATQIDQLAPEATTMTAAGTSKNVVGTSGTASSTSAKDSSSGTTSATSAIESSSGAGSSSATGSIDEAKSLSSAGSTGEARSLSATGSAGGAISLSSSGGGSGTSDVGSTVSTESGLLSASGSTDGASSLSATRPSTGSSSSVTADGNTFVIGPSNRSSSNALAVTISSVSSPVLDIITEIEDLDTAASSATSQRTNSKGPQAVISIQEVDTSTSSTREDIIYTIPLIITGDVTGPPVTSSSQQEPSATVRKERFKT